MVGCSAVWMALTIKDLHDVRALGLAHTHQLFAGAIGAATAGDEPAGGAAGSVESDAGVARSTVGAPAPGEGGMLPRSSVAAAAPAAM